MKTFLNLDQVKDECIHLLRQSDWTQLPDVPLTAAEKKAWRQYRRQLRTLYKGKVGDPDKTVFPETPDGETFDHKKRKFIRSRAN